MSLLIPISPRFKSFPVSFDVHRTGRKQAHKLEYATFGHFSKAATDAAVADLVDVRPHVLNDSMEIPMKH